MDAKPLWLVPHVAAVGQKNILRNISVFWNIRGMRSQTRETVTSPSLAAGMIRLRDPENIQVAQPLAETISQGGHLRRSP